MPCDPLRDLRAWQERLERLAAQHATAWAPPIDVYETEDRYVITAEVPGITREQVELAAAGQPPEPSADPAAAASAESPTRHYHQVERGHGSFLRTFEFADPVNQEGITADLRDGDPDGHAPQGVDAAAHHRDPHDPPPVRSRSSS